MLPVTWDTVRLSLHVLAATLWVGGQLTLAALVPALRRVSPDAVSVAARRFAEVAWVAFAVLLATGIWNILSVPVTRGAFRTTLVVKLGVVAVSGAAALAHQRATSRVALATFGALTGLAAVGAVFVGILLAG